MAPTSKANRPPSFPEHIPWMTLLKIERMSFDLQLRKEIQTRGGVAFQQLFSDIMKRRFGAAFHTVCPWGASGDWKNDGYLDTARQLFQCYAPREVKPSPLKAKIKADFSGALTHWADHFDEWVFVHNVLDGLPPHASKQLLEIADAHQPKRAIPWGFDELRRLLFELDKSDIVAVIGNPTTEGEFHSLEFADILPVLKRVAAIEPLPDSPIIPVPADKLQANLLSDAVAQFLLLGMRRSTFVEKCLRQYADPTLGDRAAAAFKKRYTELRSSGLASEQIFDELRNFAGGLISHGSAHDAAVFAVLAYFFETCDIFEAPLPSVSAQ